MKIIQINAVKNANSSTGRTTSELHDFLLSKGHQSYIAALNVEDDEHHIRLCSKSSKRIHSVLSHILGRQGFYSYFSTKRLLRKLDKIEPDVIHLRVLHSNCVNLPLLLKYIAKKDIPAVVTLHDCWFLTGHCCHFVDTNCDRWKSGCGHCPDLNNWNRSFFFDRSAKNIHDKQELFSNIRNLAVIGPSKWVTSFVKDSILNTATIVKCIYNWIDLDKFKPTPSDIIEKLGVKKESFVVLCVAQHWDPFKGIHDVIEMAKRRPNYTFVMVGNIPGEYLPLPNNVITPGRTTSVDDLVHYYSSADVFFNPSTRETFGKVTVEALACGIPVVAYNLTATPELVPENCGFITEYKDYEAIGRALDEVYKNKKIFYSDSCIKFAKETFVKEKLMNDYLELYKEIVK